MTTQLVAEFVAEQVLAEFCGCYADNTLAHVAERDRLAARLVQPDGRYPSIRIGSEGYPLLAISQRFKIKYSIVLALADAYRKVLTHTPQQCPFFDVWERGALKAFFVMSDHTDEKRRTEYATANFMIWSQQEEIAKVRGEHVNVEPWHGARRAEWTHLTI